MIRVFLAEDQTIVRDGIASLLELTADIRVCDQAADGEEALQSLKKGSYDVAILDIRMPKQSGIEVLRTLSEAKIAPPTILLTTFDEDLLFLQAIHAGAKGFLLKDVSPQRLADAIRAVARGESLLQPVMTERVVKVIQERGLGIEVEAQSENLTPREKDVLRLIAAGYSNREIGEILRISEGTVKNNTSNILGKLGARDRTRAVLRGIGLGHL